MSQYLKKLINSVFLVIFWIAAGASMLAFSTSASATPKTWTITGGTFGDAGSYSGSFIYDKDTNTYSSVNIAVTGGLLSGQTYSFPSSAVPWAHNYLLVVTQASGNFTGTRFLYLNFGQNLSNAGGTVSITGGQEGTCNATCNGQTSTLRFVTGGSASAPGSFSVTYNGNGSTGGTVPVDGATYATGASVTVKANTGTLVKTGSTFNGWNTAANGTGTSYAATGAVTFNMGAANVTLYAQWTADPTFTVFYHANGSTGGTVPANATSYATGALVTVEANTNNLVKTGSTFAGWNTAANGTGTSYAATGAVTFNMGAANVTLYAQWTTNTYTIGGTASGLGTGKWVVLQNNAGNDLTVSSNASFTFTTPINSGSAYAVTVLTQPSGQTCVVGSGSGTANANANVSTVTVSCLDNISTGSTTGGQVTAAITGGSCAGYQSGSTSFTAPVNPPARQVFPYGVFGFTAVSCGTGGTVTITLTYPNTLPPGTKYWKSINGTWVDWTSRVTISGNTVALTLTDGAYGDTNSNPGEISDPSGPSYDPSALIAGIPTLSEWGMIILSALMALITFGVMRRRQM